MPHPQPSYKGLEKRALRMLNGLLTFYYGTLNSGCYDGDGAPGGGLSMRTYSLPRVTEGGAEVPPSYGITPAPLPARRRREDGF